MLRRGRIIIHRFPGLPMTLTISYDTGFMWYIRQNSPTRKRETTYNTAKHRTQDLCESPGGRPGLSVPNKPYGFGGRKATLNLEPLNSLNQGHIWHSPNLHVKKVVNSATWFFTRHSTTPGPICMMSKQTYRRIAPNPDLLKSLQVSLFFHMHESSKGSKVIAGSCLFLGLESPLFYPKRNPDEVETWNWLDTAGQQPCQFQIQSSVKVQTCQWPSDRPFPCETFVPPLRRLCRLWCVLIRESKFSCIICGIQWYVGWLGRLGVAFFNTDRTATKASCDISRFILKMQIHRCDCECHDY